jgi:hypothetical protein
MQKARRLVLPILVLVLALNTATPVLAQQVLLVRLVSVTSPAGRGTDATIVVATAPNAACTITVIYKVRNQPRLMGQVTRCSIFHRHVALLGVLCNGG